MNVDVLPVELNSRTGHTLGCSFAVPDVSCSYDRYKYGLQLRNPYMSALSSSQIVAQYRPLRVTYLLGELDNDPDHPELDTSCSANVQGAHRFERGLFFGHYLANFYGAANVTGHVTSTVPGVGHDSRDMLTSPAGVAALFGGDMVPPAAIRDLRGMVSAEGRIRRDGWGADARG